MFLENTDLKMVLLNMLWSGVYLIKNYLLYFSFQSEKKMHLRVLLLLHLSVLSWMAPVPLMACDVVLISTLLLDLQTREKGMKLN